MDLSPAGSGTSGAQDRQIDPGDVEAKADLPPSRESG
jgi:hypothetical protein